VAILLGFSYRPVASSMALVKENLPLTRRRRSGSGLDPEPPFCSSLAAYFVCLDDISETLRARQKPPVSGYTLFH
jgi:hypothetical protein